MSIDTKTSSTRQADSHQSAIEAARESAQRALFFAASRVTSYHTERFATKVKDMSELRRSAADRVDNIDH